MQSGVAAWEESRAVANLRDKLLLTTKSPVLPDVYLIHIAILNHSRTNRYIMQRP